MAMAIWFLIALSLFAGLQTLRECRASSFIASLAKIGNDKDDVEDLIVAVSYETKQRVHLLITDASRSRYEVPRDLVPRQDATAGKQSVSNPDLLLVYTVNPFGFTVTRVSDGETIFNASGFVFKDQYLEISTTIPKDASLFGLGESTRSSGFRLVRNSTYTLWTADTGADNTDVNLYGSHPFYMDVRKNGHAHGVLLLNSNGMDVVFGKEFLTYKIIGGVFEFYFFAGPSPLSVTQQYTEVVGRPVAVPYWSLGFHQCRYGYRNVTELETVVENYKRADLPLEVMWVDIDHMDAFKDFTLDPTNFLASRLQAFVSRLHKNDQRFILIVDPGIKLEGNYATYERAKAADIFIKDSQGKPYLGQVWPGPVNYPDFLHPKALDFWRKEISIFHELTGFDGLWIDMNEASNFCSGIICSLPSNGTCWIPGDFTTCCLNCSNEHATKWDVPPYAINSDGTRRALGVKTIAMSATHYNGTLEYDVHNLYGLAEAKVTYLSLQSILENKRPFILSRSSFVGSGSVAAHWTGDNAATWNDLKYSIASILNSGLFGIPMVGADICGFGGDTTEELCNRWIQLGAFYPFSRDHNNLNSKPQELYRWNTVTQSARKALGLRYQLLPYLYTLHFEAHTTGSPVARPLFFSFPAGTLGIDTQFLLGSRVMVSPVLQSNVSQVNAYFPKGTWYNLFDYSELRSTGTYHLLQAPWDTINVHVYQGSIIPMQGAALTTSMARKSAFTLLVSFADKAEEDEQFASGDLFLDDGERSVMQVEAGKSTYLRFSARASEPVIIEGWVTHGEFAEKEGVVLDKLLVLGVKVPPTNLKVNGQPASDSKVAVMETGLRISGLAISMARDFNISF